MARRRHQRLHGAYVAGTTGSATDVVQVTDSASNTAQVSVTVTAGLSIAPPSLSGVAPRTPQTFTASGGSGTGYGWALTTNGSGGSVNPSTGAYVAGPTGNTTDVVQAHDSLGNVAQANVTVGPGVSIAPPAPRCLPGQRTTSRPRAEAGRTHGHHRGQLGSASLSGRASTPRRDGQRDRQGQGDRLARQQRDGQHVSRGGHLHRAVQPLGRAAAVGLLHGIGRQRHRIRVRRSRLARPAGTSRRAARTRRARCPA